MNNTSNLHAAQDLSRQALESGDTLRLRVTSRSMSPLLDVGDHVRVVSATEGTLAIGDFLVIQQLEGFVTHRLIKLNSGSLLTKGDRNIHPDPPLSFAQVVGRVIAVEIKDGLLNLEAPSWRGINWLLGWINRWEAVILGVIPRSENQVASLLQKLLRRLLTYLFRLVKNSLLIRVLLLRR